MSYKSQNIDGIFKGKRLQGETGTVIFDIIEEGDDKGACLSGGQLTVGTKDDGQESVFGEGDSYPVEYAFYYNTINETGSIITGATDITTVLQSDSGSNTSLFSSNNSQECLLIGSEHQFYGIKAKYDSLGDLDPNNIILEYLDSTGVWREDSYMVTNSVSPYKRNNWNLASFNSEQIRFKNSIIPAINSFEKRTLDINGVSITKFWGRIRLLTPIVQLPILQQIKMHTNRTEMNNDGVVEFFGRARGIKDIPYDIYANATSDPTDSNVVYFTGGLGGGSAKLIDNKFDNSKIDSKVVIIKSEEDIDTSTPLVLSVVYYVDGLQTGNVEFTFEYQQITEDFVYNSVISPEGVIKIIDSITVPSQNKRRIIQVEIPANETDPNIGGIAVVISRDASPTNIPDTLTDSVVLTGVNVRGRRWRL